MKVNLKERVLALSLSVFTFVFIGTVLEVVGYRRWTPPRQESCQGCYNYVPDPLLGHVGRPSSSTDAVKSCDNKACYKVRYTYDEFSRRVVGNEVNSKSSLVLFGCSYTFGEGVGDSDTIAYRLQQQLKMRVYNYAASAVGPAYALARLRDPKFASRVKIPPAGGIYIYPSFQSERNSLSTGRPWLWLTPSFKFDSEGKIVFEGSQAGSEPFLYPLYSAYDSLRRHSYFLKYLNRDLNSANNEENEDLTVALLKSMQQTFEAKFRRPFFVVDHIQSPVSPDLERKFRAVGLPFYRVRIPAQWRPKSTVVCLCDSHPNGEVNRMIASGLIEIMQKQWGRSFKAQASSGP